MQLVATKHKTFHSDCSQLANLFTAFIFFLSKQKVQNIENDCGKVVVVVMVIVAIIVAAPVVVVAMAQIGGGHVKGLVQGRGHAAAMLLLRCRVSQQQHGRLPGLHMMLQLVGLQGVQNTAVQGVAIAIAIGDLRQLLILAHNDNRWQPVQALAGGIVACVAERFV